MWYSNWNQLSTFFTFSPEIRKMIYTTNTLELEDFNSQIRNYTKVRTISELSIVFDKQLNDQLA